MGIRRFLTLAAAVPLVIGGVASPASADTVLNSIVSEPLKTFIEPGGSTVASYRIQNEGGGTGDPNSQCNATDGSDAVVHIKAPPGVTATPSSLTFRSCGNNSSQDVSFTSTRAGSYQVTVEVVDSGTGRYLTGDAAFTLTVGNARPVVVVTGVDPGAEYRSGSVPRPACSVTDDQTVTAVPVPVVSPAPYDALGTHTAACTYTDPGGKTGTASVSYTVVASNTAPTVRVTGADLASYPAAAPPSVGCDAEDVDGPITDPAPTFTGTLNARGVGERTATCSADDGAGGTATASKTYTLANTAPAVRVAGPTGLTYTTAQAPAAGAFSCEVHDPDEPMLTTSPTIVRQVSSSGVGTVTVRCEVTDADEGSGQDSRSYDVSNGAPSVTVIGPEAVDYTKPTAPEDSAFSCRAEDPDEEVRGTVSVLSTLDARGLGSVDVVCAVRDSDGGEDSDIFTYTISNSAPTVRVSGPQEGEYTTPTAPGASQFSCVASDVDEPVTGEIGIAEVLNARGIGTVTVSCSVVDASGASGADEFRYRVVNSAPTVEVEGAVQDGSYPAASAPQPVCVPSDVDQEMATEYAQMDVSGLNVRRIGQVIARCEVDDDDGGKAHAEISYTLTNTAPAVRVTGPRDASYVNGTQPADSAFGCDASDADEPTLADPDAVVDAAELVRGLGTVTVTCRVVDTDGAEAEDSVAYILTNSPPVVAVHGIGGTETYEIGAEPTVGCDVADREDGRSTTTPVVDRGALVHGLGTVTVTCDAQDTDGAVAERETAEYRIVDTGAPTISGAPSGEPNVAGWYRTPVTVIFRCEDEGGSGIAGCTAPVTLSTDGADQSATGTARDHAGNTAEATVRDLDIDQTGPVVRAAAAPAGSPVVTDGGVYVSGSVPSAPGCVVSDALSGPAGPCTLSPVVDRIGAQQLTLSGTDVAGNTTTVRIHYTVQRRVEGYFAPVDTGRTPNTVKAGSVVPLKFRIWSGAIQETSTTVVQGISAVPVTCSSAAPDDVEVLSPGATTLRYDATGAGQFIQNWQTPKAVGACYQVTMRTVDGASTTAQFKLK